MLEKKVLSRHFKSKKVLDLHYQKDFNIFIDKLLFTLPFKSEYEKKYGLKELSMCLEELEKGETLATIYFISDNPYKDITGLYSEILGKIRTIKATKKVAGVHVVYSKTISFSDIAGIKMYQVSSSDFSGFTGYTRYVLEILFDKEKGFNGFIDIHKIQEQAEVCNRIGLQVFVEYEK